MPLSSRFIVLAAGVLCGLATPATAQPPPQLTTEFRGTFQAHAEAGRGLAFSPDGMFLVTSGADGTVKLWQTATGRLTRTLQHPVGATAVAFSPNSETLATAGYDGEIHLWRRSDGIKLRTLSGHRGTVWSVSVSPDGRTVASGGEDRTVRLWNVTGEPGHVLSGHALNVWGVAFVAGGQMLASSSFDRSVRLWDVATGRLLQTLNGHTQAVVALAPSADGAWLASGGDDSAIRLWRLRETRADSTPFATLTQGSSHVYALAFSPDGQWLASGGRELSAAGTLWRQLVGPRFPGPHGHSVRLWRVKDGVQQQALETGSDVSSVAFSPDGQWLAASGEDGRVTVWRLIVPRTREP